MHRPAALFIDGPVPEGRGDRAALVTPSGPVTYASLQRLSDRAAHGLRALGVEPEQGGAIRRSGDPPRPRRPAPAPPGLRSLGVEPEQRVAIRLPDGPAWAATFFGAIKLGAVAVPINTRLPPAPLGPASAHPRPQARRAP